VDEVGGDGGLGHAIELGARVQGHHRARVDPALEAPESVDGGGAGPPGDVQTVQEDGVVTAEETRVVVQRDEAVLPDLGVGRIQVGRVDRAAGQRAVGEVMVEAAHVALGQVVATAQGRPSVAPAHDLVAEPEAQSRV